MISNWIVNKRMKFFFLLMVGFLFDMDLDGMKSLDFVVSWKGLGYGYFLRVGYLFGVWELE